MRVTDKDRKIYRYIEDNNFATVKQIGNVFYNDIIYKNELAKKRLNCLIEHNYIKKTKSVNCSQHIYYIDDKYKRQTYHNIIIMDFYTKFLEMKGVEVLEFIKEKEWNNKKVRSDALISISVNDEIIYFILEVQTSKNDYKSNLDKYLDKNTVNDIVHYCKGSFPVIVLVDEIFHNISKYNNYLQIVQLDQKLTNFPLVFQTE